MFTSEFIGSTFNPEFRRSFSIFSCRFRRSIKKWVMAPPPVLALALPSVTGRVLSIQSHTVQGYVGNKSAVFPLQLLGYDVDPINSVQFSNHTGYPSFKGQVLNGDQLWDLIEGLGANNLLYYTHLLTGYIGSVSFLNTVLRVVDKLRSVNPGLTYVCDPVLGDEGKLYVPEDLVSVYREKVVPVASMLTPNQFEAELLTKSRIVSEQDGREACNIIHAAGPSKVVITSINIDGNLLLIGSHQKEKGQPPEQFRISIPRIPAYFTGTGDLMTALLLGWSNKYPDNLGKTAELSVSSLQALLVRTVEDYTRAGHDCQSSSLEIRLIQSQDDIRNPEIKYKAEIYREMARRLLCSRLPLFFTAAKSQLHTPVSAARLLYFSDATIFRYPWFLGGYSPMFQVSRSYSRGRRPSYDLFGGKVPKAAEFRKEWAKKMEDEEDHLWTGSEDDSDNERDDHSQLKKQIKKAKQRARERSDRIDADDSDELHSIWSESEEEKILWTGDEGDDEDDVPTEPFPNERSDQHIDHLFEFDEKPKYRTLAQALKDEEEPEELSPGKLARKQAVQNALKKLKKGPDGRYTNVWEVMSDMDILIGAFENIISGPEYEELRQGGPKKLNIEFFKDIQAKMRDPNYKFSPELKLKPKSKLVSRKKWLKTESRRRKARKR